MMIQKTRKCKMCGVKDDSVELIQCPKCDVPLCIEHGPKQKHECYYSSPQKQVAELEFEGEEFETTFDDTAVIERLAKQTYPNEESGVREILVNAQGHGCKDAINAGHKTIDGQIPYVRVYLNPLDRKLIIQDVGGMGMSKQIIRKVLSCVGKSGNFDSAKAGQFGMGFYAILKLGSVVIVESWSRETGERQALMMRDGKYWKEIKQSSESQMQEYGTRLTMILYPEPQDANRAQMDRVADINKLLKSEELTNEDEITLNSELRLLQNEPDAVTQANIMNVIPSISEHSGVKTEIVMEHDLDNSFTEGTHVIESIASEEFVKITNQDVINQEYGVIQNEAYSLYFSMGETKNGYFSSGASGTRQLLVGVPIKTEITIPRFSRYVLNIEDERKFSPVASREELLTSSTTRLQSMIDKDLKEFFDKISVDNIEDYKNAEYKIPVKYPKKMSITPHMPYHTLQFTDFLESHCEEIDDGTRMDASLLEFVDCWENTIMVKTNNTAQIRKIKGVDSNNRVIIFPRKRTEWVEKQERAQTEGLLLAVDYLKLHKHKVQTVSRVTSAHYETAAHNGSNVVWTSIEDIAGEAEQINSKVNNTDESKIYIYCGSNFKELMREYIPHVYFIKDTPRLHRAVAEYNEDNVRQITSERLMTHNGYLNSLREHKLDSTLGKISIHNALHNKSNAVNYYDGNLNKVQHANKKYIKLDGLVLFLKQGDQKKINYVKYHSRNYVSIVSYDPMVKITNNLIEDRIVDYSDGDRQNVLSAISNARMTRIDDMARFTSRLSKIKDGNVMGYVAHDYSRQSHKYIENDRERCLGIEKQYFDTITPILQDFKIRSHVGGMYNAWTDLTGIIKILNKLDDNMFKNLIDRLTNMCKDARARFTRNDKIRLLKVETDICKAKMYKTRTQHKTKDNSRTINTRNTGYCVEMVFNETTHKITNIMLANIYAITGARALKSVTKVGSKLKLVVVN